MSVNGLFSLASRFRNGLEPFERVELIEGPTALLTGNPNGAVGGTVKLVPKRATDTPILDSSASYLSDSIFGGHVDVGRRFGRDNAFGIRVNGARREGDTPIDNNREEFAVASLAADYRGERLRASVDFVYQQNNFNSPVLSFSILPGFAVPDAPQARNNVEQPWSFFREDTSYAIGSVEYDILDGVTAYGSFGWSKDRSDFLTSIATIVDNGGNAVQSPLVFPFETESLSAEAGLRGSFTTFGVTHATVLAASGYRRERSSRFEFLGDSINTNINSPTYVPSRPFDMRSQLTKEDEVEPTSFAVADTLGLAGDRVLLTLGLRHQHVKDRFFDPTTGERSSGYSDSAVTPALGLVIKPRDTVSLYASYIEALGPGPTAPVGTVNAGEVFAPATSKQYEVGVKLDLDPLGLTAALFQIEQPSGLVDPATNRFEVDGEQRNRGFEVETFGELIEGVRVLGGIALIDAELTQTEDGVNDGNDAPGVSDVQVNLGVDWDVPLVPGLTIGGRAIHSSAQEVDAANTQSIPSWQRYDLGARYTGAIAGRPVTLRAGIENILDANYWQSAGGGSLSMGVPRMLLLSGTIGF